MYKKLNIYIFITKKKKFNNIFSLKLSFLRFFSYYCFLSLVVDVSSYSQKIEGGAVKRIPSTFYKKNNFFSSIQIFWLKIILKIIALFPLWTAFLYFYPIWSIKACINKFSQSKWFRSRDYFKIRKIGYC